MSTTEKIAAGPQRLFPDPTPFRQAASDSGTPVTYETADGGVVVYHAGGAVIALRRDDVEELDKAA